jgi:hypothetical protein
MKNILKYILSLVILFGTVPVNGQEAIVVKTPQTCSTQEVKECCQIASSEEIKKKKKKGKKIKKDKGKKKKKGFFSKVFGSK